MSQYRQEWEQYRKHKTKIVVLLIAEFLAFIPFVALVAVAERKLFSTSYLRLPSALLWGTLYLFTVFRLRKFPCPRCGKNFFGKIGDPQVLFDRKCAYCGLQKYADA